MNWKMVIFWSITVMSLSGAITMISHNALQISKEVKLACIDNGGSWIDGIGHCIQ